MFPCRHGTYKEIILAATQKGFKSENIHKDSITLIPHTEIIKKDDTDWDCSSQSGEEKGGILKTHLKQE